MSISLEQRRREDEGQSAVTEEPRDLFAPITTFAVQYYDVLNPAISKSEGIRFPQPFVLHGYTDIDVLMGELEKKGVDVSARDRIFKALLRDNRAPKYERFDGFHIVTTLDDGVVRRQRAEEMQQAAQTKAAHGVGWFDRK
jgi:hypothetical protein